MPDDLHVRHRASVCPSVTRSDRVLPMRLGMTLPVMEPDLWAVPDTLERWARAVDEGPFASLCFGERMAFDNPESLTLLGAAAAWTSRVRLVTHGARPAAAPAGAAGQGAGHRGPTLRRPAHRRVRGRRPGGGLPRRRGRRPADDGRDGAPGRSAEADLGRREAHRCDAPGRPAAVPGRRPAAAGRDDGAAHRALRRGLGGRAGRLHPRPRRRHDLRAVRRRAAAWSEAGRPAPLLTHVVLGRARPVAHAPSPKPAPRCTGTCATT